ncbi:MAG: Txe/YoeB family addiction module toxin [Arcobacter sp.]|jgi:toxin YoeB|uniref:Txe/YoeB family addiction module toxin n=1 Tax=Arcobacter sp. TaxID=1872629 RepID=UPI003C783A0B
MNITWTDESWEEYEQWQKEDKKVLKKINSLIKDIKRDFFNGIGKPEPLKHELTGCWSRRITDEHRLVYEVTKYSVVIISCRYHY